MIHRHLIDCVRDLESSGHLIRLEEPVDAELEAAEIHRRVFAAGGPAILFANVRDCRFPMVSNLFGTMERTRYIFRDTLRQVQRLVELKIDPSRLWGSPRTHLPAALGARHMLPKQQRRGPILAHTTTISHLPQLKSWPDDGGPFVTLPIVYSESCQQPGLVRSNLGMYRIQLAGNDYQTDAEVGLHYQLHRGIGVHHTEALRNGKPFRVNVFIGGTPAMTVAAVMPLPEGLSELGFAGALAGHRIPMIPMPDGLPLYANADFCISGTVDPDRVMPEGPFGDHLGYYSLVHGFPVLQVDKVWHRGDAIWPFTVVGRPPQEDTMFGRIIHEITGPVIPTVVPGVSAVHAVDAAGVHPLMLAIGSERYTPYQKLEQPQEVLTQANAILGQGQMSLAKYLLMVARDDDPELDIEDISSFLAHLLRRIDWQRDLHFLTRTTVDTLDYSGSGLNQGSKVTMAAVGPPRHDLVTEIPGDLRLPDGFHSPRICQPGIVAIAGPSLLDTTEQESGAGTVRHFSDDFSLRCAINRFRLVVLVDDSEFVSANLSNWLWVTFTRSDPARDIDGIGAFVDHKHWGCHGALVIDARCKPHHAPPLVEDPEITRRVDALAARGGPLSRWL